MKFVAILSLAGAMLAPAALHATPLYGTFGFDLSGVTVTPSGTNLNSNSLESINYTGITFNSSSSPEFPVPTSGTITGSHTLIVTGVDGGTAGSPFTLTFGNYGTFTEDSDPTVFSTGGGTGPQEATTYALDGTFIPGSYFAGMTGGASQILFQVNESTANGGHSYSGSGTFLIEGNVAATPEPSSLILLGTGLLGAVGAMRRRLA